jgi:beta-1,4-mannosyl-glycoprotein beta-1,4-N-acetylglucosaminyltransferase
MIYDCLMFNDEVDLLGIRLRHHRPFVDHTIIIEATHTYSGQPKELHAHESLALLEEMQAGRVTVICVDAKPTARHPAGWAFEHLQRNMLRGFSFQPDDILIYCDTDELVRSRDVIDQFNVSGLPIMSLQMDLYFYYLNLRLKRGDIPGANYHVATCFKSKWHMGKLLRAEHLRRVTNLYELREHQLWHQSPDLIANAGWHYSNLGTPERIARKCQAISHFADAEFATVNTETIATRIAQKGDLCGRPGVEFEIVPDSQVVPEALEEKYASFFLGA